MHRMYSRIVSCQFFRGLPLLNSVWFFCVVSVAHYIAYSCFTCVGCKPTAAEPSSFFMVWDRHIQHEPPTNFYSSASFDGRLLPIVNVFSLNIILYSCVCVYVCVYVCMCVCACVCVCAMTSIPCRNEAEIFIKAILWGG